MHIPRAPHSPSPWHIIRRHLAAMLLVMCVGAPAMTSGALAQDSPATPPAPPIAAARAEEESPPEPPPSYLSHDADISAHLTALFAQIDGLVRTSHSVEAGLVTLRGEVDALAQRQRAEEIASKLDHVIAVQNLIAVIEIEIPPESPPDNNLADQALKEQLNDIFGAIESLRPVKAQVKSGIVTLRGEVVSDSEREHAEELAAKIEGVLYVVNEVTVPTEIAERVRPAISQIKDMVANTVATLPLLLIALLLMFATWFIARSIRRAKWPYRKLESRPLIREIVRQITSTLVFIVGLLLTFELLDVTAFVGALLGTAGVAGLAIGFAFQDIVENYLASLMLSARQPYKKGDVVLVGDHTGKVVRMTMRDTVLMTFDGNHVRIPNNQVFKSVLTNYTHNPRRRFQFQVGVGTQENLLDVRKKGIEALVSIEGVMKDPAPFMTIDSLGDSSVVCTFYGWVDQRQHDFTATRTEAIRRIKVRFDTEGFDMPEPIYRVQITDRSALEISDGDSPAPKRRDAEPLEDDTMQNSINEHRNLSDEAGKEDQRDDEDLL